MMAKLDETRKRLEELKTEYVNQSKIAYGECSKELFDKYPELDAFTWNQYTPYFSDGDENIFSVNGYEEAIRLKCNNVDIDIEYLYLYAEDDILPEDNAKYNQIIKECSDLLGAFDDEIYKSMYGDHCSVTLYRDGSSEIEDYDHD